MKKGFLLLFVLAVSFAATAQEKNLELTTYCGWNTYSKQGSNAYSYNYKGDFGIGFQAKYYIKDIIFWVTDLYGGLDDGTYHNGTYNNNVGFIVTQARKDFSIATGVGVNLFKTNLINGYLQLLGGFGTATGTWSDYVSESEGIRVYPLAHTSFIISPAIGVDFKLTEQWKLGMGYTYRFLFNLDASHSLALRATYVIN